jgi:hypothetical protein
MHPAALTLVLAGALHGAAAAEETFQFRVQGSGTHLWNFWECEHAPDPPTCAFGPGPYITDIGWFGSVDITTSDGRDGVYTGSDLLFEMSSNWASFITDGYGSGLYGFGMSVTLADGRVTDVRGWGNPQFPSFEPYTTVSFSGLTASFTLEGCHHCGSYHGTAELVAIPEPGTWLLTLAGLALVAAFTTRRRRPLRSSTPIRSAACDRPPRGHRIRPAAAA